MMGLESKIEAKFVGGIKRLGGRAIKIHSPWFTGLPDRLVIIPFLPMEFVELKAPGKDLKPRQKVVHEWLKKMGVPVCVIDSEEKVSDYLLKMKNAIRPT